MPIEWLYGAAGGVMIGIAAAIFLLANGRIMGASGILGSVVDGTAGRSLSEKLVFIAALVAVPGLAAPLIGRAATHATGSVAVLVVAGLAVGIGTRLAGGCTSGHGVCGIPRLSVRSIVATLIYVGMGALTVLLARHVLGLI
ncbi:MAG TPA: YeeE/YedE family protein [Albidovulum sp.]|uniref:YeeE/YedE family protein n=1 Tax=Albidovulum sp. TaxID=1872424 RepID=UPI002D0E08E8|nr:YeeE/YedE family protein [Albidovulum sp.]